MRFVSGLVSVWGLSVGVVLGVGVCVRAGVCVRVSVEVSC